MQSIFFFLLLVMNFGISWHNAKTVGRMWSESKVIGGSVRVLAIAGYIMAIGGFTMVYGCILFMLSPYIIPLIPGLETVPVEEIVSLSSDMLYLLMVTFLIPSGFIIWFKSTVHFWRQKTLKNGMVAGWNTYAQLRNTVNAVRNVPSVVGRIMQALFGGKGKKKGNAVVILLAIFILILAVCGGWFTASAIMKKADREYDGLGMLAPKLLGVE